MIKSSSEKMPPASKLSRRKKVDPVKPPEDALNESAEDFVEQSDKKCDNKRTDKKKAFKTPESQLSSCDGFPKCPFCGKTFPVGQEIKRLHLHCSFLIVKKQMIGINPNSITP
jgi:hypothetical protein